MLAVVFYHAFPRIVRGGYSGVDVFFVISGFLISGIIFDALAAGKFSFTDFYARRIRRIFPALATVLIAALTFGWFTFFSDEYAALGKHTAGGAGFCANILSWLESSDYWATEDGKKPLVHLWSLGVEEQFYLLIPALTVILFRWRSRMFTVFGALFAASFVFNLLMRLDHAAFNFYFPATRFWELFAGVLLALAIRNHGDVLAKIENWGDHILPKIPLIKKICGGDFRKFLSLTGAILLAVAVWVSLGRKTYPGFGALVPVIGATFLIWAGANAPANRLILSNRVMVAIGLISYPLYLWHWVLLSFGRVLYRDGLPVSWRFILIGMAFVLATFTYFIIEKPLRFGKKFRRIKTVALAAVMLAVGLAGWWINICGSASELRGELGAKTSRLFYVHHDKKNEQQLIDRRYGLRNSIDHYYGKMIPSISGWAFFNDVGSDQTVAIVGDSHAQMIYTTVAGYCAERGVNCLLLACGGGVFSWQGRQALDVKRRSAEVAAIADILFNKKDIKKIIISNLFNHIRKGDSESLQETVNTLTAAGKEVIIRIDNPQFPFSPFEYWQDRPLPHFLSVFFPKKEMPKLPARAEILAQQQGHREAISRIVGATVVDSLDVFCPDNDCVIFDEAGNIMYVDSNHLSLYGAEYQVKHQLAPYLDFPAGE